MHILAGAFRRMLIATLLCTFVLTTGAIAQEQETFTVVWSGLPLFIPDSGGGSVAGSLFVPYQLEIADVDVEVEIAHPKIKDLVISLAAPDGSSVRIADRVCDTDANFPSTVFDDQAAAPIGSVCPPGTAPYQPSNALSRFNGGSTFGEWVVRIEDREKNDFTGFLLRYSITVTGNRAVDPTFSPAGVVNEASKQLDRGFIAIGELVSIFGAALGPVEPVLGAPDPDTGAFPTELGGVRVLIEDQWEPPLLFVSQNKITFQVPWEVPPQLTNVSLQVFFEDRSSEMVTIGIRNTAPGIFALDGTGRRQAKVVNEDGTLNDPENPAPAGSVIVVYATGLGEVQPSVPTGMPAPTNQISSAVFPVTATINGVDAPVHFAGLAPGLVGVNQINIEIPVLAVPFPAGTLPRALLKIENDWIGSQDAIWISIE